MVNKVNPGEENGNKENKKEDKGRKAFVIKDAKYLNTEGKIVSAINSDGLLIAVPTVIKDGEKVVYVGYDVRKHLPLKKSDFAGLAIHMRFQAFVARCKAGILIKNAEEKEAKADRIEKFGDETTRRKVQKVARMKEQLEALQRQLEQEGVDISSI